MPPVTEVTTVVRCGGRSRAASHCTVPPYDPPIMPILPFDQGCSAIHSMVS